MRFRSCVVVAGGTHLKAAEMGGVLLGALDMHQITGRSSGREVFGHAQILPVFFVVLLLGTLWRAYRDGRGAWKSIYNVDTGLRETHQRQCSFCDRTRSAAWSSDSGMTCYGRRT